MDKISFWEWLKKTDPSKEEIKYAKECEQTMREAEQDGIICPITYDFLKQLIEEGRY